MACKPYKKEVKIITAVRLYPSTKAKAKRLGLNISKFLESAIAGLPEPQEEEGGAIDE